MFRLDKTVLVWIENWLNYENSSSLLVSFRNYFLQELFPSGIISFKVNYIGIFSFTFAGHM
jgi:hypothetical protein